MSSGSHDTATAVALCSGGLDSTVSLAMAFDRVRPLSVLFFDYEQHAVLREEEAARGIASRYGLSFTRVELPWLGAISRSALIAGKGEPPVLPPDELSGGSAAGRVWVENRNGVFINIAAAYAVAAGCEVILVGFNIDEARAFPDNSEAFLERVNASLALSAGSPVRVESPTLTMSKREVVREGLRRDVPWELIWSCYAGGAKMCGHCESCLRLRRAVAGTAAGERISFAKE